MKLNETQVKRYMRDVAPSHKDDCGDVNLTSLVEDAASALNFNNVGGPLDDPEHDVWNWAFEVSQE